jgi:SEC-C motif
VADPSLTSYLWDKIIQKTCDNWLAEKLLGDGQLLSGRGAIHEMAKEPRFMRREAVERIRLAIAAFPEDQRHPARHLSFFNSYNPEKGYVFLQLWIPPHMRGDEGTYRAKRQEILRIACGVAKNHNPTLEIVVGIAIPPPKFEREIGEDFLWLDCSEWSNEMRAEYDNLNLGWNFFETGLRHEKRISEFVIPQQSVPQSTGRGTKKIGWNELCHCGSGKKFKKCHGP